MREFSRRFALATAFAATTGVLILSESADAQQTVTTPSGLKYIDVKAGTGASPKTGQTCVMHYTGWLYEGARRARNSTPRSITASRSNSRSACTRSSPVGTKASPP